MHVFFSINSNIPTSPEAARWTGEVREMLGAAGVPAPVSYQRCAWAAFVDDSWKTPRPARIARNSGQIKTIFAPSVSSVKSKVIDDEEGRQHWVAMQ